MKVRVVKEDGGRVSLLVISEGRPPIPAVALQGLTTKEAGKQCRKVLEDIEHQRSLHFLPLVY